MNGIAEQKAVIDELIGLWKFDESNFCVTCMIRTPLRSKHCRRCQRCVAKHDQYVSPLLSYMSPPPPPPPRGPGVRAFANSGKTATAPGSTTVWA